VQTRDAITEEWLACVLRTYPEATGRFLGGERDPFRNPVGTTLKEALSILLDELLLGMQAGRVSAALDSIAQIRAVQDGTPGEALEFIFQLKRILRARMTDRDLDLLYTRIDEMALQAFDLYMKYRERTYQAQKDEYRRRFSVIERRMAKPERGDA
jgi:RsbT co-antagonist protein rsbRD N-terminal domain